MRVLLDGWQMIYSPLSAAAFHILEIFDALQSDAELTLALPDKKPFWLTEDLDVVEWHRSESAFNHLRWVQSDLPRIARQIRANIIHSFQATAPLFASQVLFYSSTEQTRTNEKKQWTLWQRLENAFGMGGLSRAIPVDREGIFENHDREGFEPEGSHKSRTSSFFPSELSFIPQTRYFLYQSFGNWERLYLLLQVWSKTSPHLGDQASLAIICSDQNECKKIEKHSSPEFQKTLHLFENITPFQWKALLKEAIALIQLEEEPLWGGTARRAIGQGVPVVGFELPSLGEAVGPAGYLVPEGDARSLSAALMTLVVEDDVLNSLQDKAQQQAQRWDKEMFRKGLLRLYRQVISL